MSSLGTFGGAADIDEVATGGGATAPLLMERSLKELIPSPSGQPATQFQIDAVISTATAAASATTTSTGAWTALNSMTMSLTMNGRQSVYLFLTVEHQNDTAGRGDEFKFFRGTTELGPGDWTQVMDTINQDTVTTIVHLDQRPAAGTYTYSVGFRVSAASTVTVTNRIMLALVVPDRT